MKKEVRKIFWIYYIIFYAVWTVAEIILFPYMERVISNKILLRVIWDFIVKNVIWTVISICMIRKYADDVQISLKDMFTTKVNWIRYIPVFVLFAAYITLTKILFSGGLRVNGELCVAGFIPYIVVGLTEEMAFRGWMLNVTVGDDKKAVPVLLNALMFLMIHFPKWIRDGMFIPAFTSLGFVSVVVLSIIFSACFLKSKSIVVPLALHTFYDVLMYIFE